MQTLSILLAFFLLTLTACADEPTTTPASQPAPPAGLDAKITISNDPKSTAEITISNPTTRPLSIGYLVSYSLTRTDATPPQTIAASPANSMRPHFRLLIQPGDSKTATLPLSENPLPAGHYQFTITYPPDMFPNPLQKEFDIPVVTTKPN